MAERGERVPAKMLFFIMIMRIKPKMDCVAAMADIPINCPWFSSTRLITACEAIPPIPQPIELPIQASPSTIAGPIIA